jgi:hypothetical protein
MQMSNINRALLALAAVGVLIGAFALLSGSGDDDKSDNGADTVQTATGPTGGATVPEKTVTSTTTVTTTEAADEPQEIEVEGGKPKGGIAKIEATNGDRVRFKVTSDVADEIHVHGYDLMKDVAPGKPVTFSFEATIEGRFEVELEERGVQIARLEVTP